MRAVKDREIVIRVRVDDEGGALVNADSLPTVEVRDGDGALVTTGAVAQDAATAATGVYKATVNPRSQLDVLTIVWTVVVGGFTRKVRQEVMVQGGRLVPLWRLREDSELAGLSTTAMLRLVDAVEDWFKAALHFPAVEEPLRTTFNFAGGRRLRVPDAPYPKSLVALSEGDAALTTADLADVSVVQGAFEFKSVGSFDIVYGTANRNWLCGRKTAWLTHGGPWSAVPEDVERAAALFARYISRANNYPERASQVATEGALISLAMPDHDHPTGLPDVDAVITKHRLQNVV